MNLIPFLHVVDLNHGIIIWILNNALRSNKSGNGKMKKQWQSFVTASVAKACRRDSITDRTRKLMAKTTRERTLQCFKKRAKRLNDGKVRVEIVTNIHNDFGHGELIIQS
jgi:hypothetical protein